MSRTALPIAGRVLACALLPNKHEVVVSWTEIHKDDLAAGVTRAGEPPPRGCRGAHPRCPLM